ncbi:MAG: heparinase II/III family protein, partial [Planctomycetota bacterium]
MTYFIENFPAAPYDEMHIGEFKPTVPWGLLNTGVRLSDGYWCAYMGFLHSEQFTDDVIVDYTKLMIEMAMRVRARRGFGNWETMQMHGMYSFTLLFPECSSSPEWKRFAVDTMYHYLQTHLYPDGCNIEITRHYQALAVLNQISEMVAKAQAFDDLDSFPKDFVALMEKSYDFNLRLMPPDRTAFNYGEGTNVFSKNPPEDPGDLLFADFYAMERAVELFPERADFRWVATDGAEGKAPDFRSTHLPSGFAVMRSDWSRTANYLAVKASEPGLMHGSFDVGNLALWAHGRPVLWHPLQKPRYSRPKNVMLVDGLGQEAYGTQGTSSGKYGTKEPVDMDWQSTDAFDYAATVYAGFYGEAPNRPCRHVRKILYVKPDLFLVIDDLQPFDDASHEYEARWVIKSRDLVRDGVLLRTIDKGQPNLEVIPVNIAGLTVTETVSDKHPDFQGQYGDYSDITVAGHRRSGSGDQRFVTLLAPLKNGQASRVESVSERSANHWIVKEAGGDEWDLRIGNGPFGEIQVLRPSSTGDAIRVACREIKRPFMLHHENFEVYDLRESKVTYDRVRHQVAPPAGIVGKQGRFAGEVTIPASGRLNTEWKSAFLIEPAQHVQVSALVGARKSVTAGIKFRINLIFGDKTVRGDWLELTADNLGSFKRYQQALAIPAGSTKFRLQLQFESQPTTPTPVYVDDIRIYYPGESISSSTVSSFTGSILRMRPSCSREPRMTWCFSSGVGTAVIPRSPTPACSSGCQRKTFRHIGCPPSAVREKAIDCIALTGTTRGKFTSTEQGSSPPVFTNTCAPGLGSFPGWSV